MIDIKLVRDNPAVLKESLSRRRMEPVVIDEIAALDEKRRALLTEVEELKADRNTASKEIGKTKDKEEREKKIAAMRTVGDRITELDQQVKSIETKLDSIMATIQEIGDLLGAKEIARQRVHQLQTRIERVKTRVIDVQKPVISVGREDHNDIVIQYAWISRTHAYIENRNDIFMVKDKSTNGTFIYPVDSEPIFIKKGEHPLVGKGIIIFGRERENKKDNEQSDTIVYNIKQDPSEKF